VGTEAVLRTTDDSIIIEKTLNEKGIPEFKIGGTVTLKEVLANYRIYEKFAYMTVLIHTTFSLENYLDWQHYKF
jgi:hypothetical protein